MITYLNLCCTKLGGIGNEPSVEVFRELSTFVGRERELAELKSALENMLDGNGQMFLVFGEPRILKTTLASELTREGSSRGLSYRLGRCWEGSARPHIGRGRKSSADL